MSPLTICSTSQAPGALTPARLRQAKELMLHSPLSIIEIAGLCNLTRSHFSRAFKVNTGLSPQAWRLLARMEKAKRLLVTEVPITHVSLECGFCDQSHFTRAFSRLVGQPPKAWRRTSQNAASGAHS
ncbi:AraC family transcriptional regulator [Pseudomonas sp. P1B16]|jgi:AraC-type DNA-binding domain-containing proteins|uniref:helix-turn-helix domain-containing protein n=1 Tax=unclassified Pseudomonas TaxID=196821 RepID=UPI00068C26BC|nr:MULTISPECIES: AraC family transcriptional regulator [unclassified Pseudomonas]MBC3481608.1 helix-turn-helix transcriptional regulator [Pseudomonas sp. SWRI77]MDD2065332.1 AraC family transcriptional regulator [Pseudomonas sp. 25571]UDU81240.1 AraC family transcriptional regulator [Pseudomonas sp. HN2-3]WPM26494.1 AraC family transcriptional regulator [Pseudomonas sp. P1B16]